MNNDKMVEELAKKLMQFSEDKLDANFLYFKPYWISLADFILENNFLAPKTLPNVNWPKRTNEDDQYDLGWNACLDACKKAVGEAQPTGLDVTRKLEIADMYYKDGYRNGYIEGFNKQLENTIKQAELKNEPIIFQNSTPALPSVKEIGNIIDKFMPCSCMDDYKKRNMSAPDCCNCNHKEDLATAIYSRLKGEGNEKT